MIIHCLYLFTSRIQSISQNSLRKLPHNSPHKSRSRCLWGPRSQSHMHGLRFLVDCNSLGASKIVGPKLHQNSCHISPSTNHPNCRPGWSHSWLVPHVWTKLWPADSSAFIKEQGVLQVHDEPHDNHTTNWSYVCRWLACGWILGNRVARMMDTLTLNDTHGPMDDKISGFLSSSAHCP